MAEEKESNLRDEIYARMAEKDTEDLIEIYQENDLEARTEESLEIVRQILLERLGKLPEPEAEDKDEVHPAEEEEFEFPQDKVLYRIADWSSWLSGAILIVGIINVVLRLRDYFAYTSPDEWLLGGNIFNMLLIIFSQLQALFYVGFLYIFLRALTEIIYLLMDIRDLFHATEAEENTIS